MPPRSLIFHAGRGAALPIHVRKVFRNAAHHGADEA